MSITSEQAGLSRRSYGLRWAMMSFAVFAFSSFNVLPLAFGQCGSPKLNRSQAIPVMPQAAFSHNGTTSEPSAKSATPGSASITGLWQINFLIGGEVVDTAFDVWHSDGTEFLNDFSNPINGNVCVGAWAQAGTAYKLKHPSWYFDDSGTLLGTEMIHETVQVTPDGNHFGGTFLIDVYDTQGNLLEEFGGTVKASRITP